MYVCVRYSFPVRVCYILHIRGSAGCAHAYKYTSLVIVYFHPVAVSIGVHIRIIFAQNQGSQKVQKLRAQNGPAAPARSLVSRRRKVRFQFITESIWNRGYTDKHKISKENKMLIKCLEGKRDMVKIDTMADRMMFSNAEAMQRICEHLRTNPQKTSRQRLQFRVAKS